MLMCETVARSIVARLDTAEKAEAEIEDPACSSPSDGQSGKHVLFPMAQGRRTKTSRVFHSIR